MILTMLEFTYKIMLLVKPEFPLTLRKIGKIIAFKPCAIKINFSPEALACSFLPRSIVYITAVVNDAALAMRQLGIAINEAFEGARVNSEILNFDSTFESWFGF
jgi:hypothetical protein